MTNARTTLTLGTVLKSANGSSHEVIAILDRTVFARSVGGIRSTAYAWDKDGNSLSLNADWDMPDLANYYVPEMWSLENLPKVKAANGYTYLVVAQTADEQNRVVYCNLGASTSSGLYAWDFDGNALWASKDPDWFIEGMGDVLDLYLDAKDAFDGVDWEQDDMVLSYVEDFGWEPVVTDPTEEQVEAEYEAAVSALEGPMEIKVSALDLLGVYTVNTPAYDENGIPEGCMGYDAGEDSLPALEALSDYLSVLMDGKLDGEEILTQILTAYHADEDR